MLPHLNRSRGNYFIQETKDGSQTLYSQSFHESCHSLSGAHSETLYNYIEGAKLYRFEKYSQFSILEVGFGTGLGVFMTQQYFQEYKAYFIKENKKILFTSLELDPFLIQWSLHEGPLKNWKGSVQEKKTLEGHFFVLENEYIKITILIGDARLTLEQWFLIQNRTHQFQAIFQDPFSPKKNPRLWTTQWFSLLKTLSHPDVILATYSSAKSMRMSLRDAGFSLKNRKGFAQKKLMTIAELSGNTSSEVLLSLQRSPLCALND